MGKIDVQGSVVSETVNGISRGRSFGAWRMPEAAKAGFEDTRARTNEVNATELGVGNVERASQLTPICNIGLYEYGSRSGGSSGAVVRFYGLLSFWSKF